MSVSFEALAMAGVDYNECGISMEEWERLSEMTTPPHLLAEEEDEEMSDDYYKGHISLEGVPVFKIVEESGDMHKGAKKLPMINLVKQLSSKTMMIERIEENCPSKLQPGAGVMEIFIEGVNIRIQEDV